MVFSMKLKEGQLLHRGNIFRCEHIQGLGTLEIWFGMGANEYRMECEQIACEVLAKLCHRILHAEPWLRKAGCHEM